MGYEDEGGEHELVQLVQGAAVLGRCHLGSTGRLSEDSQLANEVGVLQLQSLPASAAAGIKQEMLHAPNIAVWQIVGQVTSEL